MKINRSELRKLILQEVKLLSEERDTRKEKSVPTQRELQDMIAKTIEAGQMPAHLDIPLLAMNVKLDKVYDLIEEILKDMKTMS